MHKGECVHGNPVFCSVLRFTNEERNIFLVSTTLFLMLFSLVHENVRSEYKKNINYTK